MSQWAPGFYDGLVLGGVVGAAGTGTPKMDVRFNIGGHEKVVTFWFSERAADISLGQLATLGFNKDFADPQFSVTTPVRLELKYEPWTRRDGQTVQQERWQLARTATPLGGDQIQRLNALAKGSGSFAPPPPNAVPPSPNRAANGSIAPPPAPNASPTSHGAPPPPVKKSAAAPCTRDAAWNLVGPDVAVWNDCIDKVCKETGKQEAQFTDAEWGMVAGKGLPF